jgi:transcription elongation factor GreB
MSKAFTRESDDQPEPPPPRLPPLLPPGVKNYLTPDGARAFQEELARLVEIERPSLAAAAADSSEQRQRLQMLEQRIQQLRQNLHRAEVVPPPPPPWDQVRFGATVTVRNAQGERSCYRIVGAPEMDAERGWVSWLSPIARALLNGRLGQRVRFKFPSGEEQLEILDIAYGREEGGRR